MNNKGLTLIEVILSIAIIGIISISIFTSFGTGLSNIIKAGERTDKVYQQQEELDNQIINNEELNNGTDEVIIVIPNVGEKKVTGKILETELYTTFVPNKVGDQ